MNKKIYTTLIVVIVAFSMCLIVAQTGEDDDAKKSTTFKLDDYKYKVLSSKDKTVQLIGSSELPISVEIPDVVSYKKVSYTVKSIGENAFKDNVALDEVSFGTHLTKIEKSAFQGCENLTHLDLKYVETIGKNAFKGCEDLTDLVIPDTTKELGDGAFDKCTELERLTLPITLNLAKNQKTHCFRDCNIIKEVTLTKGADGVGVEYNNLEGYYQNLPWNGNKYELKKIVVSEGVATLGQQMFMQMYALESVTLPTTLKSIKSYTFMGCESLKSIKIPDGMDYLGIGVFKDCKNITEITIPASLNATGLSYAFYDCMNIEKVTLTPGTKKCKDYYNNNGTPWYISKDNFKTLIVTDGVEYIGKNTFKGCTSLTEMTLPDSLKVIKGSAFEGCTSLKSLVIPSGVETIFENAFKGCGNIGYMKFSNGLKSVDGTAFEGFQFFDSDGVTRLPVDAEHLKNHSFSGNRERMIKQTT